MSSAMFALAKAVIKPLLRQSLGPYVKDLPMDKLTGEVGSIFKARLGPLELRPDALRRSNLPIVLKAGSIGSVVVSIPLNTADMDASLEISDVYIVAGPLSAGDVATEEERERAKQESKMQQVHAAEEAEHTANVRAYGSEDEVKKKSTVLGRFLERILQRLCVTVERIHLQYEDGVSNPKQPYTLGLRLASLRYQGRTNADILEAMRDMAENFSRLDAGEIMHKELVISDLCIYLNSSCAAAVRKRRRRPASIRQDSATAAAAVSPALTPPGAQGSRTPGALRRLSFLPSQSAKAATASRDGTPHSDPTGGGAAGADDRSPGGKARTSGRPLQHQGALRADRSASSRGAEHSGRQMQGAEALLHAAATGRGDDVQHVGWEDVETAALDYVVQPTRALAAVQALRSKRPGVEDPPLQRVRLSCESIELSVKEEQFQHLEALVWYLRTYSELQRHLHLRPRARPLDRPADWWHYAGQVVLANIRRRRREMSLAFLNERWKQRDRYVLLHVRAQHNQRVWLDELPPQHDATGAISSLAQRSSRHGAAEMEAEAITRRRELRLSLIHSASNLMGEDSEASTDGSSDGGSTDGEGEEGEGGRGPTAANRSSGGRSSLLMNGVRSGARRFHKRARAALSHGQRQEAPDRKTRVLVDWVDPLTDDEREDLRALEESFSAEEILLYRRQARRYLSAVLALRRGAAAAEEQGRGQGSGRARPGTPAAAGGDRGRGAAGGRGGGRQFMARLPVLGSWFGGAGDGGGDRRRRAEEGPARATAPGGTEASASAGTEVGGDEAPPPSDEPGPEAAEDAASESRESDAGDAVMREIESMSPSERQQLYATIDFDPRRLTALPAEYVARDVQVQVNWMSLVLTQGGVGLMVLKVERSNARAIERGSGTRGARVRVGRISAHDSKVANAATAHEAMLHTQVLDVAPCPVDPRTRRTARDEAVAAFADPPSLGAVLRDPAHRLVFHAALQKQHQRGKYLELWVLAARYGVSNDADRRELGNAIVRTYLRPNSQLEATRIPSTVRSRAVTAVAKHEPPRPGGLDAVREACEGVMRESFVGFSSQHWDRQQCEFRSSPVTSGNRGRTEVEAPAFSFAVHERPDTPDAAAGEAAGGASAGRDSTGGSARPDEEAAADHVPAAGMTGPHTAHAYQRARDRAASIPVGAEAAMGVGDAATDPGTGSGESHHWRERLAVPGLRAITSRMWPAHSESGGEDSALDPGTSPASAGSRPRARDLPQGLLPTLTRTQRSEAEAGVQVFLDVAPVSLVLSSAYVERVTRFFARQGPAQSEPTAARSEEAQQAKEEARHLRALRAINTFDPHDVDRRLPRRPKLSVSVQASGLALVLPHRTREGEVQGAVFVQASDMVVNTPRPAQCRTQVASLGVHPNDSRAFDPLVARCRIRALVLALEPARAASARSSHISPAAAADTAAAAGPGSTPERPLRRERSDAISLAAVRRRRASTMHGVPTQRVLSHEALTRDPRPRGQSRSKELLDFTSAWDLASIVDHASLRRAAAMRFLHGTAFAGMAFDEGGGDGSADDEGGGRQDGDAPVPEPTWRNFIVLQHWDVLRSLHVGAHLFRSRLPFHPVLPDSALALALASAHVTLGTAALRSLLALAIEWQATARVCRAHFAGPPPRAQPQQDTDRAKKARSAQAAPGTPDPKPADGAWRDSLAQSVERLRAKPADADGGPTQDGGHGQLPGGASSLDAPAVRDAVRSRLRARLNEQRVRRSVSSQALMEAVPTAQAPAAQRVDSRRAGVATGGEGPPAPAASSSPAANGGEGQETRRSRSRTQSHRRASLLTMAHTGGQATGASPPDAGGNPDMHWAAVAAMQRARRSSSRSSADVGLGAQGASPGQRRDRSRDADFSADADISPRSRYSGAASPAPAGGAETNGDTAEWGDGAEVPASGRTREQEAAAAVLAQEMGSAEDVLAWRRTWVARLAVTEVTIDLQEDTAAADEKEEGGEEGEESEAGTSPSGGADSPSTSRQSRTDASVRDDSTHTPDAFHGGSGTAAKADAAAASAQQRREGTHRAIEDLVRMYAEMIRPEVSRAGNTAPESMRVLHPAVVLGPRLPAATAQWPHGRARTDTRVSEGEAGMGRERGSFGVDLDDTRVEQEVEELMEQEASRRSVLRIRVRDAVAQVAARPMDRSVDVEVGSVMAQEQASGDMPILSWGQQQPGAYVPYQVLSLSHVAAQPGSPLLAEAMEEVAIRLSPLDIRLSAETVRELSTMAHSLQTARTSLEQAFGEAPAQHRGVEASGGTLSRRPAPEGVLHQLQLAACADRLALHVFAGGRQIVDVSAADVVVVTAQPLKAGAGPNAGHASSRPVLFLTSEDVTVRGVVAPFASPEAAEAAAENDPALEDWPTYEELFATADEGAAHDNSGSAESGPASPQRDPVRQPEVDRERRLAAARERERGRAAAGDAAAGAVPGATLHVHTVPASALAAVGLACDAPGRAAVDLPLPPPEWAAPTPTWEAMVRGTGALATGDAEADDDTARHVASLIRTGVWKDEDSNRLAAGEAVVSVVQQQQPQSTGSASSSRPARRLHTTGRRGDSSSRRTPAKSPTPAPTPGLGLRARRGVRAMQALESTARVLQRRALLRYAERALEEAVAAQLVEMDCDAVRLRLRRVSAQGGLGGPSASLSLRLGGAEVQCDHYDAAEYVRGYLATPGSLPHAPPLGAAVDVRNVPRIRAALEAAERSVLMKPTGPTPAGKGGAGAGAEASAASSRSEPAGTRSVPASDGEARAGAAAATAGDVRSAASLSATGSEASDGRDGESSDTSDALGASPSPRAGRSSRQHRRHRHHRRRHRRRSSRSPSPGNVGRRRESSRRKSHRRHHRHRPSHKHDRADLSRPAHMATDARAGAGAAFEAGAAGQGSAEEESPAVDAAGTPLTSMADAVAATGLVSRGHPEERAHAMRALLGAHAVRLHLAARCTPLEELVGARFEAACAQWAAEAAERVVCVHQSASLLHRAGRADDEGTGWVSMESFRATLADSGVFLHPQELDEVAAYLGQVDAPDAPVGEAEPAWGAGSQREAGDGDARRAETKAGGWDDGDEDGDDSAMDVEAKDGDEDEGDDSDQNESGASSQPEASLPPLTRFIAYRHLAPLAFPAPNCVEERVRTAMLRDGVGLDQHTGWTHRVRSSLLAARAADDALSSAEHFAVPAVRAPAWLQPLLEVEPEPEGEASGQRRTRGEAQWQRFSGDEPGRAADELETCTVRARDQRTVVKLERLQRTLDSHGASLSATELAELVWRHRMHVPPQARQRKRRCLLGAGDFARGGADRALVRASGRSSSCARLVATRYWLDPLTVPRAAEALRCAPKHAGTGEPLVWIDNFAPLDAVVARRLQLMAARHPPASSMTTTLFRAFGGMVLDVGPAPPHHAAGGRQVSARIGVLESEVHPPSLQHVLAYAAMVKEVAQSGQAGEAAAPAPAAEPTPAPVPLRFTMTAQQASIDLIARADLAQYPREPQSFGVLASAPGEGRDPVHTAGSRSRGPDTASTVAHALGSDLTVRGEAREEVIRAHAQARERHFWSVSKRGCGLRDVRLAHVGALDVEVGAATVLRGGHEPDVDGTLAAGEVTVEDASPDGYLYPTIAQTRPDPDRGLRPSVRLATTLPGKGSPVPAGMTEPPMAVHADAHGLDVWQVKRFIRELKAWNAALKGALRRHQVAMGSRVEDLPPLHVPYGRGDGRRPPLPPPIAFMKITADLRDTVIRLPPGSAPGPLLRIPMEHATVTSEFVPARKPMREWPPYPADAPTQGTDAAAEAAWRAIDAERAAEEKEEEATAHAKQRVSSSPGGGVPGASLKQGDVHGERYWVDLRGFGMSLVSSPAEQLRVHRWREKGSPPPAPHREARDEGVTPLVEAGCLRVLMEEAVPHHKALADVMMQVLVSVDAGRMHLDEWAIDAVKLVTRANSREDSRLLALPSPPLPPSEMGTRLALGGSGRLLELQVVERRATLSEVRRVTRTAEAAAAASRGRLATMDAAYREAMRLRGGWLAAAAEAVARTGAAGEAARRRRLQALTPAGSAHRSLALRMAVARTGAGGEAGLSGVAAALSSPEEAEVEARTLLRLGCALAEVEAATGKTGLDRFRGALSSGSGVERSPSTRLSSRWSRLSNAGTAAGSTMPMRRDSGQYLMDGGVEAQEGGDGEEGGGGATGKRTLEAENARLREQLGRAATEIARHEEQVRGVMERSEAETQRLRGELNEKTRELELVAQNNKKLVELLLSASDE